MKTTSLFSLIASFFVLFACSNDDAKSNKELIQVGFYLTDAPARQIYKSVQVEILSMSYSINDKDWKDIQFETPIIVDLLKYANGEDTLLSNITLQAGTKIHQIRLHLGDNNSVTLENESVVSLKTPSGQSSGLKINVQSMAEVTSGYRVIIDFDASRSLVQQGNGTLSLKPVIRAYISANSAAISGYLSPNDELTRVFVVTSSNDTIATLSDTLQNNFFMLHGLFSGTYDLQVENLVTQKHTILKSDIEVIGGTDIELGLLDLPIGE